MKTNIVSVFILIATFGISSQNVIRIQENKIGEFSLFQVYLTDSTLLNGLSRAFAEKQIEKPYIIVNNAYLLDMQKTSKKIEVKITPAFISKDFSQLCIGYFQIQEYLVFINNGSYNKLFKKTRKTKRFNFYESELVTNGLRIKSPKGSAPIFYIYELTKNSFEFKEKIVLN
jgi:hypothetical protein